MLQISLLPPVQMRLMFSRDSSLVFEQEIAEEAERKPKPPAISLLSLLPPVQIASFCELNGRHYFFRYWMVVAPIVPLNSKGAGTPE
jgi:hypothetical protein